MPVVLLRFVLRNCTVYQQLSDAENKAMGIKDNDTKEVTRAVLSVSTARARLARVLQYQVRWMKFDHHALSGLAKIVAWRRQP